MRQIATGADGTGYMIDYAMKREPEDIEALKMAAIKAEDGSEDKQNRIRAYQQAAKEWADSDGSKGAYLIADAKLVGIFDTGKAARQAAVEMEPWHDDEGPAQLRWRTE